MGVGVAENSLGAWHPSALTSPLLHTLTRQHQHSTLSARCSVLSTQYSVFNLQHISLRRIPHHINMPKPKSLLKDFKPKKKAAKQVCALVIFIF